MATRVVDLGNVRGPKGDTGNTGPQGPQGLRGPAGSVQASCLRPSRLVVGTTAAGWTTADCDYLCTGNEDQVKINAAIAALPAHGGEIVLLDGTYYVGYNAPIALNKANVTLRGSGPATRVECSTLVDTIEVTASDCTIRDLYVYSKLCSAVNSTGDRLTLLNLRSEGGSSGGESWVEGTGAMVMGCRFEEDDEESGNGGLYLNGSGHMVMGNVCCYLVNNATGCVMANNIVP